jgi:pimeloyl-ACP methyl ester carboxylesterase
MVTQQGKEPAASTMRTTRSTDGTKIAYWRSGSGPAVVLVHGTTLDHTAWDYVLPELEPYCTVYTLDRRGRGESGDQTPYALAREFEDVAAVANDISGPVHVMGHSFGGLCALGAAQLTPNIASLVLYEPPVIGMGPDELPSAMLAEIDALIAQDRRDEATGLIYRAVVGWSAEEIEQLRSDTSWSRREASAHTVPRELRAIGPEYHFPWGSFRQFDRPTLLLTGELSPAHMRACVGALSAVLPNCRVVELKSQAHAGFRTATKLVIGEALNFVNIAAAGRGC